ncbi:MAG: DUF3108 domain-containing protein [Bacteriovoracaceae bacterium]|nr:DUF3108 domain-containing protein [Bacteriovoracaceae bacterium]
MNKLLILSLFLSVSCSTTLKDYFSSNDDSSARNEELMKDFDVDSDVLEKFKTQKAPKEVEDKNEEVVSVKKEKTQKKVVIKKTPKKTKNKQVKKKEYIKSEHPEDYPKDLIILNKKNKNILDNFKPSFKVGEKAIIDMSYLGVSTGKISLEVAPMTVVGGRPAYHFKTKLKTARFYRYLYELDDTVDSYVYEDSFTPAKFSLIQRESSQNVDALQLFDGTNHKVVSFYKRVTKKKTKKKKYEGYIPKFYQDPLSLIYFIRGLNMKIGAKYDVPFINRGIAKIFAIKILKKEKIDTKVGQKLAYKVLASSNYDGSTLKSGDMTFWFSADQYRAFLKFKAKIKIGSISGDIEQYQP